MFCAIPKAAAEWVSRLHAGPISAADKHALARWLADKPDRSTEFENASFLWDISSLLDESTIARSYLKQDFGTEVFNGLHCGIDRLALSGIADPGDLKSGLAVRK